MNEDLITLITILNEVITTYEEKIEVNSNSSSNTLFDSQLELIEEDINNIASNDIKVLEDLIKDHDNVEEKEKVLSYMTSIKTLLKLNKEMNTTYSLSDEQISYYERYVEIIKQIKNKKSRSDQKELIEKQNKYKKLLKDLTNSNNFITNLDLIDQLLDECEVPENTRANIYLSIMKYNEILFKGISTNNIQERIDESELESVFKEYNYKYKDLTETEKNNLLYFGNIKRIKEIFELLDKYKYPKLSGTKLVTILINSDKKALEEITTFAHNSGLTSYDMSKVIPALISSNNKKERRQNKKLEFDSLLMNGKNTDFINNVKFLENEGFSIKYIFDKCKELLVVSHERLLTNYNLFKQYGFEFELDESGYLIFPALTCLISTRFQEIVDQFIEISPEGLEYIRENPSRILTISDPQSIIFYNIYASYLDANEFGDELVIEGPYLKGKNVNGLKLRGEITRHAGSPYKDVSYRGVTEANKQEKTMTITPEIDNKMIFDEAVATSNPKDLVDLTVGDDVLEAIERYTDPNDKLKYNFNGKVISKLKVYRIYNILKNKGLNTLEGSLLYSITYNTIMNKEDLEKITRVVKGWRR